MNRFEEIEKLKELEQKARPAPWEVDTTAGRTAGISWEISQLQDNEKKDISHVNDIVLLAGLRNAAPLLLDIAGQIHFGDDKLLTRLIYEQEDLARFMAGFGGVHQSERVMIDMLKRYQKMAERMHDR